MGLTALFQLLCLYLSIEILLSVIFILPSDHIVSEECLLSSMWCKRKIIWVMSLSSLNKTTDRTLWPLASFNRPQQWQTKRETSTCFFPCWLYPHLPWHTVHKQRQALTCPPTQTPTVRLYDTTTDFSIVFGLWRTKWMQTASRSRIKKFRPK